MNIKLTGKFTRSEFATELTWAGHPPEDVAALCDVEITFRAFDRHGCEIYPADEGGRHMGYTIGQAQPGSGDQGPEARSLSWHFPGIGEALLDWEWDGEWRYRPKQR